MSQCESTKSQLAICDLLPPNNWRRVRIGDICEVATGGTPDTGHPEYYGGNIRWLKSGDIKGQYIFDVPNRITELGLANSNARVHPVGSVMLAMSGQGKTRGMSSILKVPSSCSQSVAAILPSPSILPEFLYFSLVWLYEDIRRITGSNERTGLNLKIIRDIRIQLPPLSEQKHIAEILAAQMTAVMWARAAAEAQLNAAKDLPAAYLRAVFDSTEAQSWTVKRLDEVCFDISDGTHFTPTYVPRGVPFLSVKDVKENGISFSTCRYITEEQHSDLCKRCKPEKGDVLYTKVGTTGIAKAIDVDREFSIFVSVALLKLKPEVLPGYVEKVLNSSIGKAQAADLTQGMANRNLVIRDIRRIEIPIPPIETQKQIVKMLGEQLTESEQMRGLLQTQLESINKMPSALLREAFNGRL